MIHYQLIGAVRDPYIEKNKVELKKVLKSGKEINGAKLVTNINMQVK